MGLPEPPVTPAGTPGLKIELVGDRAGSVSAGDPILHKGYPVGRIESAQLDVKSEKMRYLAFIKEEYQQLVNSSTRFWNASGISFQASADGIQVQTSSLITLLMGGVSFGSPDDVLPGELAQSGDSFKLYPDYATMNLQPYREGIEYILRFDQSVRGLQVGAPVEYRGVRVGQVEDILIKELSLGAAGEAIPVLITVQPGRLLLSDDSSGAAQMRRVVATSVEHGMRASLATGSFITGAKYISLDVHERDAGSSLGTYAGRPTIPTSPSGLEGLEYQVSELLDKLNDMPIEELAESAVAAVESANRLLASQSIQELPASLDATLAEIRSTLAGLSEDSPLQENLLAAVVELDVMLRSVGKLANTLNEQPNSLVFARRVSPDPVPPAGLP